MILIMLNSQIVITYGHYNTNLKQNQLSSKKMFVEIYNIVTIQMEENHI